MSKVCARPGRTRFETHCGIITLTRLLIYIMCSLSFLLPGLEHGLEGMKAGGERVITIPSKLGYGSKGSGLEIPPDLDLAFEVKVLKVG